MRDRFYMGACRRQVQAVEHYTIVKRADNPFRSFHLDVRRGPIELDPSDSQILVDDVLFAANFGGGAVPHDAAFLKYVVTIRQIK